MEVEAGALSPEPSVPTAAISCSPRRQRILSGQTAAERENTVRRAIDFGGGDKGVAESAIASPPTTTRTASSVRTENDACAGGGGGGGTIYGGAGAGAGAGAGVGVGAGTFKSPPPSSASKFTSRRRRKVADTDASELNNSGTTAASSPPSMDQSSMLSENSTMLPSDQSPFHVPGSVEKIPAPRTGSPLPSTHTHRRPTPHTHAQHLGAPPPSSYASSRRQGVRTIDALQAMIMGSPGSPDTRYGLAGGSSASSSQTSVSAVLSGMVSGASSGGRPWQCGKELHHPGYHAVLAEGAVQYKRCKGWRRRCLMYEAFSTWQLAKRNVAAQVAAVKKNQSLARTRLLERSLCGWRGVSGQGGGEDAALWGVACRIDAASALRRMRETTIICMDEWRHVIAKKRLWKRHSLRVRCRMVGRVVRGWGKHAHAAQEARRKESDRISIREGVRLGKLLAHVNAWRRSVLEGRISRGNSSAERRGMPLARAMRAWARQSRRQKAAASMAGESKQERAAACLLQEVTNLALMLGNEADDEVEAGLIQELMSRSSAPLSLCGLPAASRPRDRAYLGVEVEASGETEQLCQGVKLDSVVVAMRELVAMLLLRKKAVSLQNKHMRGEGDAHIQRKVDGLGDGGGGRVTEGVVDGGVEGGMVELADNSWL